MNRFEIVRLSLGLTYRCNSHCMHCRTWRTWRNDDRKGELSLAEYEILFKSKCLSKLTSVSITGGEPFLYEEINELIDLIHIFHPSVRLVFNTNSTLSTRTYETLSKCVGLEFPEILLNLSIDGMEINHDLIRGIPGAFKKTVAFVEYIKSKLPSLRISLSFTATPSNFNDAPSVLELAERLGVGFTSRLAQNSYFYDNTGFQFIWSEESLQDCELIYEKISNKLAAIYNRPESSHVVFLRNAVSQWKNSIRNYDCWSGTESLYVDPQGNVYPCIMLSKSFGNVRKNFLDQIVNSNEAHEIRHLIMSRECRCWTECESMNSIIKQKRLFQLKEKGYNKGINP